MQPDLPSELATDISNAFKHKATALGAAVSLENLHDFYAYVQGTINDALRERLGLL
jgi:thiamine biosynthesis protein ThiC